MADVVSITSLTPSLSLPWSAHFPLHSDTTPHCLLLCSALLLSLTCSHVDCHPPSLLHSLIVAAHHYLCHLLGSEHWQWHHAPKLQKLQKPPDPPPWQPHKPELPPNPDPYALIASTLLTLSIVFECCPTSSFALQSPGEFYHAKFNAPNHLFEGSVSMCCSHLH